MLHLESYKRYSQRNFSFDDAIDYIDQGIRRLSGGSFKVRIEIEENSQVLANFPHEDIPNYLNKWEYPNSDPDNKFKYMYRQWKIKFDYFWQHDQKMGNRYLAKKMFNVIKELPQGYWSDSHVIMGLKSKGNEIYLKQYGNWIILHVRPTELMNLLDKYFEREVNAEKRKEWVGNVTYSDINNLIKDLNTVDFKPKNVKFRGLDLH